jgi:uncharacterized protein
VRSFAGCVVKLTAYCNLNCTYCYMFNLTDHTFKRIPKIMSMTVAESLVARLREYIIERDLSAFHVTLHGGEPTLWPVTHFKLLFEGIEKAAKDTGITIGLAYKPTCYGRRPFRSYLCCEVIR